MASTVIDSATPVGEVRQDWLDQIDPHDGHAWWLGWVSGELERLFAEPDDQLVREQVADTLVTLKAWRRNNLIEVLACLERSAAFDVDEAVPLQDLPERCDRCDRCHGTDTRNPEGICDDCMAHLDSPAMDGEGF